jgi:glycosyltransferase involved in cell wall biosynthesis
MLNRVSILVPVYNNAETILPLIDQVKSATQTLARQTNFVFVDDASTDRSASILDTLTSDEFSVISNGKNLGQQLSIRKGLGVCDGQVVIVMDADLQDPPKAIPELLMTLHSGRYDAVFATRIGNYQSYWRMLNSYMFRFLMRRITNLPRGAGGFVAMTDNVAMHLAQKSGRRFYMAGMIGCNNYRIGAIPVERNLRDIGKSEYTFAMRLSLGFSNFIFVFSERITRGKK